MHAIHSFAFVAVVASASASAQTPETLAREIATTAYVSAGVSDEFVTSYVKSFTDGLDKSPQTAQLFAARPELRTAAINAARLGAKEQYDAIVLPSLVQSIASFYQTSFSASELAELGAYYRTPQAQRLLASFSASNAAVEVPAAKSDPVVLRFLASAAGQKEKALSAEIATAMATGMMRAGPKVNAAVLPRVQQAVQAAASKRPS